MTLMTIYFIIRYMDDQSMGHTGHGNGTGTSLPSWLSGFPNTPFSSTGPHDNQHNNTSFTSSSPTPFDDGSRGPHSILGFPGDMSTSGMNFVDPSLSGLGNKMGGFSGSNVNVGMTPTSIVTSSTSSHETDQLFTSRLQQQQPAGNMPNVHKLDYVSQPPPTFSPSLMGYSPMGSMTGPHSPSGHISPTFGQSGPGVVPGGQVVTKQETFVDCHQSPGPQNTSGEEKNNTSFCTFSHILYP